MLLETKLPVEPDRRLVLVPHSEPDIGDCGGVSINISSSTESAGPKTILVDIDRSVMSLAGYNLQVMLDGTTLSQAPISEVLNPTSSTPPVFCVVSTASAYQILVYIPHFSAHNLRIVPVPVAYTTSRTTPVTSTTKTILTTTATTSVLHSTSQSTNSQSTGPGSNLIVTLAAAGAAALVALAFVWRARRGPHPDTPTLGQP